MAELKEKAGHGYDPSDDEFPPPAPIVGQARSKIKANFGAWLRAAAAALGGTLAFFYLWQRDFSPVKKLAAWFIFVEFDEMAHLFANILLKCTALILAGMLVWQVAKNILPLIFSAIAFCLTTLVKFIQFIVGTMISVLQILDLSKASPADSDEEAKLLAKRLKELNKAVNRR